ncbi:MAG: RtcB family protein [Thermus sp.]|uniref:RtcB family protein n=1 Tax=Thermus sp. TaxID=275 RepID=UPI00351B14A5
MHFEKIAPYTYRIPKQGKMRVDAVFFASEEILKDLEAENFASLQQLMNVATLPGIVEPALAMPDIHWGYGFPIGGVAAFDPEEGGVVSPGGVGFDINCLPGGTRVLAHDRYNRPIEELAQEGDPLLVAWRLGECPEAARALFLLSREGEELVRLRTEGGFVLEATPDHPVYTPIGMRPLGELRSGDQVAVHPFRGLPYEPPPPLTLVGEEAAEAWAKELGFPRAPLELRARGLLPLRADHPHLPALLRLMGYSLGDGTLYRSGGKAYLVLYGAREGLLEAKADLERLGFRAGGPYLRWRRHSFRGRAFSTEEASLKVSSRALLLLLRALGLPEGAKAKQGFRLPPWLFALPSWLKANFLAGLFGAELSAPKAVSGHGYNLIPPVLSQSKRRSALEEGRAFMQDLARLLVSLGLEVQDLREEVDWEEPEDPSHRFKLILRSTPENLARLYEEIGYAYAPTKARLALLAAFYLRKKEAHLAEREALAKKAWALREAGYSVKAIAQGLGVSRRFVERTLYEERRSFRPQGFPTFPEFVAACEGMLFDRVVAVERVAYGGRVYDLSMAHPDHNFVAEGFVVSNCGVRLLTSHLTLEDLLPRQRELADALYRLIPSGVGSERRDVRFSKRELKEILKEGAGWLVKRGYGYPEDVRFMESEGRLPWANPDKVSERAFERGAPQIGTLGSGNHFLEVQYVDEVYDLEAAEAYGLFRGQITVLIHTGSRGLGHQVCQDYVERFLKVAPRYGIELVDKQLAAAPIQSPEGQDYLQAMAAAANFAFANRQLIAHFVREAFEAVGYAPRDHGLRVLYDLAHNNAKFEEHKGRRVLVHRKGATRAFGPGNPEIPPEYRRVGQPVLVPGDMGRYSYVLAGTAKAMEVSFGSSCHGAGRKMSRHQAKRVARERNLVRELAERGILVRAATRATVDEEMPEAYKDVSLVVEAVEGAGIGKKVARLRPLIVVKG